MRTATAAGALVREKVRDLSLVLKASVKGPTYSALFDGVESYCMFVGYPRSGHSLVGSLLDAHPEVVIAHELDVLKHLHSGRVGRDALFWLILRQDREFTLNGRVWRGYDYAVPGQWQGRYDYLRVIGDKKGGKSTWRLARQPESLEILRRTLGIDVRIIHVVRNPFDNIATMTIRGRSTLPTYIDRYFDMCRINEHVRCRGDVQVLDLRLEDLIADPAASLMELCQFLRVEPTPGYVADCANIVLTAPRRTRTQVPWTLDLIADVQRETDTFEFLRGYEFDG